MILVSGVDEPMAKVERIPVCDGVTLQTIHDDRFKTGRISAVLLLPLQKETAAANMILPFLLRRSCAAYPDFTMLNRRLADLYGAYLYADVRKIGETQALILSAVGLDDRFTLDGESVSAELSKLLCNLLFEPAFENGRFREEDIEQERRQLIELIDSEYNDKRLYALSRCEELMCEGEAFGIARFGSREEVERLTEEEIHAAWERALSTARIEITFLGASNPQAARDRFAQAFSSVRRGKTADCRTEVLRAAKETREKNDRMEVAQCKLVLGFRAGRSSADEDVMATRLMSALFGGTPSSKLFLNVREKLSLCYYCSSRFERNKGLLLVESGVEYKNIEKAKKEILAQLGEIQKGNITDEELEAAKLYMANSFRSVSDAPGGLESWYLSQLFDRRVLSPEEAAEEAAAVSKEAVRAAANAVSLDLIYTLTGKGEQA